MGGETLLTGAISDAKTDGRGMMLCRAGAAALALAAAPPAAAAPPGTHIDNVAALRFTVGGVDQSATSNTVTIVVDERLDLTLARTGSGAVPRDPKTTVAATLTNTGSGQEAFMVAATLGGAPATGLTVAIDGDGNGQYDPSARHAAGGRADADAGAPAHRSRWSSSRTPPPAADR